LDRRDPAHDSTPAPFLGRFRADAGPRLYRPGPAHRRSRRRRRHLVVAPGPGRRCVRSDRRVLRDVRRMQSHSFFTLLVCVRSAVTLPRRALAESTPPTPARKRVAWAHYDSSPPPVLRAKSGDPGGVQTPIASPPPRLEAAGVEPNQVEPSLRDIVR